MIKSYVLIVRHLWYRRSVLILSTNDIHSKIRSSFIDLLMILNHTEVNNERLDARIKI